MPPGSISFDHWFQELQDLHPDIEFNKEEAIKVLNKASCKDCQAVCSAARKNHIKNFILHLDCFFTKIGLVCKEYVPTHIEDK